MRRFSALFERAMREMAKYFRIFPLLFPFSFLLHRDGLSMTFKNLIESQ